jgi:hypothetical protein
MAKSFLLAFTFAWSRKWLLLGKNRLDGEGSLSCSCRQCT